MSDEQIRTDFSVGQKIIHWLMALFVLVDLTVAQGFGDQMEMAERLDSREGHAAFGTIILILLIIRIFLRRKNGAPALSVTTPAWQVTLARITHLGFYVLLTVVIVTGIATASFVTDPLNWFGAFDISFAGNDSEAAFQSVRIFHEIATKALIALILVHFVAALYHGLILRDNRLGNMLKFWKSSHES